MCHIARPILDDSKDFLLNSEWWPLLHFISLCIVQYLMSLYFRFQSNKQICATVTSIWCYLAWKNQVNQLWQYLFCSRGAEFCIQIWWRWKKVIMLGSANQWTSRLSWGFLYRCGSLLHPNWITCKIFALIIEGKENRLVHLSRGGRYRMSRGGNCYCSKWPHSELHYEQDEKILQSCPFLCYKLFPSPWMVWIIIVYRKSNGVFQNIFISSPIFIYTRNVKQEFPISKYLIWGIDSRWNLITILHGPNLFVKN